MDEAAKFYYYLCMLIESDLHDLLKTMFPGTWTRQLQQQVCDVAQPSVTQKKNAQNHEQSHMHLYHATEHQTKKRF